MKGKSAQSEEICSTASSIQHSHPRSLQHILGNDRKVSGQKINKIVGRKKERRRKSKGKVQNKSKHIIRRGISYHITYTLLERLREKTPFLSLSFPFLFLLLLPAIILSECTLSNFSHSLSHPSYFSGNIFFKPISSLQQTKNKTGKLPI